MHVHVHVHTYIHTDTHTFMHMYINPTLQCTATRRAEFSNLSVLNLQSVVCQSAMSNTLYGLSSAFITTGADQTEQDFPYMATSPSHASHNMCSVHCVNFNDLTIHTCMQCQVTNIHSKYVHTYIRTYIHTYIHMG